MSVGLLGYKKIIVISLIFAIIASSTGYVGWKHFHHVTPKPGLLKIGQTAPTTTTFDFHELGVKVILPPDLKDLKYFDQVSADKTYASLNLYMDSYTTAAKKCLGVAKNNDVVPITLINRYPGKYSMEKSTIANFDLLKQFNGYFIVSSKPFTQTCKDKNNQAEFDDYDTRIRSSIRTTFSNAVIL